MHYPVFGEADFQTVPKDAEQVHLVRPLKKTALEKLFKGRNINVVFASKSTRQRLGKKALQLLKQTGVSLVEQKRAGRAISIDLKKLQELVELHKDYQSFRKIEKLTGIPKSTAHYLIKYAQRAKIRADKNIIYL
ncbi:MAG: hypothetical protein HYW50_01520 [Candidatus Diapherotrites archaeon]|nr:hypothetical protein [Candidatus Diapherotrites archaeon]